MGSLKCRKCLYERHLRYATPRPDGDRSAGPHLPDHKKHPVRLIFLEQPNLTPTFPDLGFEWVGNHYLPAGNSF
jgi:hypothetical protein